jgi:hypothetical protein
MKLRQVLELCRLVILRGRCRLVLLRLLLRVLLVPPGGLTTLNATGYGGRCARDDRGTGCHA